MIKKYTDKNYSVFNFANLIFTPFCCLCQSNISTLGNKINFEKETSILEKSLLAIEVVVILMLGSIKYFPNTIYYKISLPLAKSTLHRYFHMQHNMSMDNHKPCTLVPICIINDFI